MYRERGTVGSKSEVLDRKRINEIHDNRASHSMSQPVNGKGKGAANSVLMGKQQLHDRDLRSASLSKTNISDAVDISDTDSEESEDDFNLCGLSHQVPYYDYALDLILDVESSHGEMFTEDQNELIESAAEMLYGMIHARYILTSKGLASMLDKYKNYDFGRCPRVYCCGQPCLPVGQSDIPRASTVKIYCPKCEDVYYPRSKYQGNIDGAYFGTTFPHLFLMTYGHLKPQKASQSYTPRVFGFKLHKP
ncbi:Casein kinase II subunit beta-2 [Cardamine amara subsp. amara]|uniref:Casein kinase II subunit beta n=1 Tax=Cardamine amara subsp. amara TaxID=228776 RepID=A0ABD1AGN1_CARAN